MRFKSFFIFLLLSLQVIAQDTSQTFLSLKPTGVEDFLSTHKEYDGRGTVIFVFDTGVDMGVDGLTLTSTGETKVIDVRDFTGQGDVPFTEAEVEKESDGTLAKAKGLSVKGIDKLSLKPTDGKYYLGNLDEERFRNSTSGVKDINGNRKTNDNYIIVVFKTTSGSESYWVAYVDTDADGTVEDEQPIRSYGEKQDNFKIANPDKLPYFTFALNIFPETKTISVVFDDGGHGTHVAGIAAGYSIGRDKHFNGVGIGAKVIAVKIGNNNLSGGATVSESMKKAYLFADEYSRKTKMPCIINMSFGIGSVLEGTADMEMFLKDLLSKNPYLYVCTSNGNNGPGISSSGLPASSNYVFSSGAVLTKEVGRDLYGALLNEDIVLHFSARGGEVAKPDIVSPGACASTVANWQTSDRMWGTSMASPYTAGVMSLLLSAVSQKYPDVKLPARFLFNAVRQGAVKLPGYTQLDQGAGYINVVKAFDVLEKAIKNKEYENQADYNIVTYVPGRPDNSGTNIYFRNGNVIDGNDIFRFNISRANGQSASKFYRAFRLVSDSDWLIPVQKNAYLRNTQGASVEVKFDKTKMTEPGLYTGKVTAYRTDKNGLPEFDLRATVIIPFEFTAASKYRLKWKSEKLAPGRHKRYFLNIPAGASALTVNLSSEEGVYNQTIYRLFDPDGVNIYASKVLNSNSEKELTQSHYNLRPGVYEIVVHGNFTAKETSTYGLAVEISGVKPVEQNVVIDEKAPALRIINELDQIKQFELRGELTGYKKEFTARFEGTDHFSYPFVIRKDEKQKEFRISVPKEDFNKFTDFSVMIFDEAGNAIVKDGFNYQNGEITVFNTFGITDSTKLRLEIIPAFAIKPGNAYVSVTEITEMSDPIPFTVKNGRAGRIELYPAQETILNCLIDRPHYYCPSGTLPYGKVYLKSLKSDGVEYELPFVLKINKENI